MVIRRTSNQRIRTRAHSRKTQHIVSHKPREWTGSLRCSLHVAALHAHHYFTIAGIRALSELQKIKHRFDVLPISLYDPLLIDLIHLQVLLRHAQLTISPCFLGWLQKLSMTPPAPSRASRDNFIARIFVALLSSGRIIRLHRGTSELLLMPRICCDYPANKFDVRSDVILKR